jgi:hypothetical protein
MSTGAKVCRVCQKDCATRPRVKDPQGRYTCRTCYDAKRESEFQAAQAESGLDAGDLAALVQAEAAVQAKPRGQSSCPQCRAPLPAEAVLCTACGYDLVTRKAATTNIKSAEGPAMAKASEVVGTAANGLLFANPIAWLVAAALGASAGTVLWAVVALNTNASIGWLLSLAGIGAGGAAVALARERAGVLSGSLAAVAALLVILTGRFITVDLMLRRDIDRIAAEFRITPESGTAIIADKLAVEWEKEGKPLKWPPGMNLENAYEPEDYPPDLWAAAEKNWNGLDAAGRDQIEADFKQELLSYKDDLALAYREQAYKESFSSASVDGSTPVSVRGAFWNTSAGRIIVILIALALAYSIGAGHGLPWS